MLEVEESAGNWARPLIRLDVREWCGRKSVIAALMLESSV